MRSGTKKISRALADMISQLVKVCSSYDRKVSVPEYIHANLQIKTILTPRFKKHLKVNTLIKIDVLNLLLLTKLVVENSTFSGIRKRVKDVVSGLYSVYQKDMGQNSD